jgi:hypothetical protein
MNKKISKLRFTIDRILILIVTLVIFIFIIKKNGQISFYKNKIKPTYLICLILIGMMISQYDMYISTLIFILLLTNYKFAVKEFFQQQQSISISQSNNSNSNNSNNSNSNLVVKKLRSQISNQLQYANERDTDNNIHLSDDLFSNIFNKYFKDNNILGKLENAENKNIVREFSNSDNVPLTYSLEYEKELRDSDLIGIDNDLANYKLWDSS